MTYIIPNRDSKKFVQDNKSDLTGNVYSSRNISTDEEGYIKLAEATFAQYTTDDSADFDTVDAMFPSDGNIYINSDEVFRGRAGITAGLSSLAADTNVPTPGVEDDVIFFNDTEVVSDGTLIKYQSSAGVWTTVSLSFSTSFPVVMTVFDGASSLAVGNNNTVKFVNTSWAVNGTVLTIPVEYQVSSLKAIGNNLYVATRSKSGGDARIFVVDSIQASADYSYPVGTFELPSIKSAGSSIVGINSLGQLVRFNGGGFDTLGVLPIYKTGIEWSDATNDYSSVSNRGLATDGDLIYLLLSSKTQDGRYLTLPYFQSGVWCYDSASQSFYHRYSPSFSKRQEVTGPNVTVSSANNTFTLTAGNLNNVVTGMPVFYDDSGGTIPELKSGGIAYYIIKNSSTEFKLATSYTNAVANTAIDITGTGNVGNSYIIVLTNDYGWTYFDNRSSMAVLNNQLFEQKYVGRICLTAELFAKQSATTDKTVFCPISAYLPNRGYFVTPKLTTASVKETYNTVAIKYKPLGIDDKIIIKGKFRDRKDYPKTSIQFEDSANWVATWTDTDTFTTVLDLSDAVVGDEIEILSGVGAGHIAHISSISVNSGTYTVNLDDAFPFAVANDVMYFQIDNFTKIATITSTTSEEGVHQFTYGNHSKFSQFKIEMRGIGVTVEEFMVSSKEHTALIN